MTKKERVLAAFRGEPVDKVPVCVWKHVPGSYWEDYDAFAQYQLDYYKATDVDFMKLSADGFFGWPDPVLDDIESADELFNMQVLPADHPWIRAMIERTKKVVQAFDGEIYCFSLIFVPVSYLRLQTDYPTMMRLFRENPDAMRYALDCIAETLKIVIDGLIDESGVDGIFFSVQNAEVDRFTKEEYLSVLKPSEMKVIDYIKSKTELFAIHFCGWEAIPNRLSVWEDYHAPVVNWARYIDIRSFDEMRKWTGGSTLWGGFDNRPGTVLYTGTKEELEAEVKNIVDEAGKTGFILGADCSCHPQLSDERIRWMVDAAHSL